MENQKLTNNETPLHQWTMGNIIHTMINLIIFTYLIFKLWQI
jgi:hypothetical protein